MAGFNIHVIHAGTEQKWYQYSKGTDPPHKLLSPGLVGLGLYDRRSHTVYELTQPVPVRWIRGIVVNTRAPL